MGARHHRRVEGLPPLPLVLVLLDDSAAGGDRGQGGEGTTLVVTGGVVLGEQFERTAPFGGCALVGDEDVKRMKTMEAIQELSSEEAIPVSHFFDDEVRVAPVADVLVRAQNHGVLYQPHLTHHLPRCPAAFFPRRLLLSLRRPRLASR